MQPAQVGDEDAAAQRRAVGDAVHTGAECLNPAEPDALLEHPVGHVRAKCHQHVGVGDIGVHLGVVLREIDGHLGKCQPQTLQILRAHGLGKREQEQDIHASARPT